jgi:hypothetical protein
VPLAPDHARGPEREPGRRDLGVHLGRARHLDRAPEALLARAHLARGEELSTEHQLHRHCVAGPPGAGAEIPRRALGRHRARTVAARERERGLQHLAAHLPASLGIRRGVGRRHVGTRRRDHAAWRRTEPSASETLECRVSLGAVDARVVLHRTIAQRGDHGIDGARLDVHDDPAHVREPRPTHEQAHGLGPDLRRLHERGREHDHEPARAGRTRMQDLKELAREAHARIVAGRRGCKCSDRWIGAVASIVVLAACRVDPQRPARRVGTVRSVEHHERRAILRRVLGCSDEAKGGAPQLGRTHDVQELLAVVAQEPAHTASQSLDRRRVPRHRPSGISHRDAADVIVHGAPNSSGQQAEAPRL